MSIEEAVRKMTSLPAERIGLTRRGRLTPGFAADIVIMDLPNGYSTLVKEKGNSLSGGQRQRITIARTLLGNPKLLVMDEATSSLDYENERRVFSNLINHFNTKTVFFITHRLSTIKRADLILFLHKINLY